MSPPSHRRSAAPPPDRSRRKSAARWMPLAKAAFWVLAPLVLLAFAPLLSPLWLVTWSRGRRFAGRRAAARWCAIDARRGATLDILEAGSKVEEIPLADLSRARWWVHAPSSSFPPGDDEEILLEIDSVAGRRTRLLLGWNSYAPGLQPLIARGLLSRKPRDGGRGDGACLGVLLLLALGVWCVAAALLWLRYGGALGEIS